MMKITILALALLTPLSSAALSPSSVRIEQLAAGSPQAESAQAPLLMLTPPEGIVLLGEKGKDYSRAFYETSNARIPATGGLLLLRSGRSPSITLSYSESKPVQMELPITSPQGSLSWEHGEIPYRIGKGIPRAGFPFKPPMGITLRFPEHLVISDVQLLDKKGRRIRVIENQPALDKKEITLLYYAAIPEKPDEHLAAISFCYHKPPYKQLTLDLSRPREAHPTSPLLLEQGERTTQRSILVSVDSAEPIHHIISSTPSWRSPRKPSELWAAAKGKRAYCITSPAFPKENTPFTQREDVTFILSHRPLVTETLELDGTEGRIQPPRLEHSISYRREDDELIVTTPHDTMIQQITLVSPKGEQLDHMHDVYQETHRHRHFSLSRIEPGDALRLEIRYYPAPYTRLTMLLPAPPPLPSRDIIVLETP